MMRASEYFAKGNKPEVPAKPLEEIDWVQPRKYAGRVCKPIYDIRISKSTCSKGSSRIRYTFTFYSGIHELITDNDTCAFGFVGDRIYFCKPSEGILGYTLGTNGKQKPTCENRTTSITDTRCEKFIGAGSSQAYYELCYDPTRRLCYVELPSSKKA